MSTAVVITRMDHTPAELRALAAKSDDVDQARRPLAIAMALEGTLRLDAARQAGIDRQTLRDWVHRYNEGGVDGLVSRKPPGAAPKLTEPSPCHSIRLRRTEPWASLAQMAELRELVIAGPDPKLHKVIRWRCLDLREEVARRFSVIVPERTIGKWLRKLKLTRLQPRPYHPKKDAAAQEAFKKNFSTLLKEALLGTTAAAPVEIWFQDEARVGQKGSLSYVWGPVGSRPPMVRDNRHDSAYIFGAICPARSIGAAIITPTANTECMNLHLAEISTQVAPGSVAALICDGAGWHQRASEIKLPENIVLLPLPPYAPELNPMENVWEYLRGNKLSAGVWNSYDAIVEARADAWNWFVNDLARIRSIGTREWATVNV
jgi:transposase